MRTGGENQLGLLGFSYFVGFIIKLHRILKTSIQVWVWGGYGAGDARTRNRTQTRTRFKCTRPIPICFPFLSPIRVINGAGLGRVCRVWLQFPSLTVMEFLPFCIRCRRLLSLPNAPAPTVASSSAGFTNSSLYTAPWHPLSLSSHSSVSQSAPYSLCFTSLAVTASSLFTFNYSLNLPLTMLTNYFPSNLPGSEMSVVLSVILLLFVFSVFSIFLQNQHLFV